MAVRSGSHLDFYILRVHHRFPTVTVDPMEITSRIPHAPFERRRTYFNPDSIQYNMPTTVSNFCVDVYLARD